MTLYDIRCSQISDLAWEIAGTGDFNGDGQTDIVWRYYGTGPHQGMIDIWYMLIFGVIGYVFKKLDYPLAPLVLALVLGDMAENALRQSLIMSQGSLAIFFNRPIAGAITAMALFFFVLPIITPWWRRLKGMPASASQTPLH